MNAADGRQTQINTEMSQLTNVISQVEDVTQELAGLLRPVLRPPTEGKAVEEIETTKPALPGLCPVAGQVKELCHRIRIIHSRVTSIVEHLEL